MRVEANLSVTPAGSKLFMAIIFEEIFDLENLGQGHGLHIRGTTIGRQISTCIDVGPIISISWPELAVSEVRIFQIFDLENLYQGNRVYLQ